MEKRKKGKNFLEPNFVQLNNGLVHWGHHLKDKKVCLC